MSILDEVKRLAVSECANFSTQMNGIRNSCWERRGNGFICAFFADRKEQRCPYFEKAVLPLDGDLQETYLRGAEERREDNGTKVEHREFDQGEGFSQSIVNIQRNYGKVEVERLPLAKFGRKGFLSRR